MAASPSANYSSDPGEQLLASFRDLMNGSKQQAGVVGELLRALSSAELRSIFGFYASKAGERNQEVGYGISLPAWVEFVADIRVGRLIDPKVVFAAACGLHDASDALMDELQFLGALVRLAHTVSSGDGDLHDALQLLDRLKRLLEDCVLPFARRSSLTGFNKVMGIRPELMDFLEECRHSFSGLGLEWERWLEIWNETTLSQIPGYPDWEPEIFRTMCKNFGLLLRVFSYYTKLSWLRSFDEFESGEEQVGHSLALDDTGWTHFLTDCRLNLSKAHEEYEHHYEHSEMDVSRFIPYDT